MQIDVENIQREKVGTIDLPDEIFMAEVSPALLWEQVKAQRASRRQGTHKTKGRSEVRGGGAKPFKQKGTGRARQGTSRAPQMVGGGTVHGPRPRDYSYRLPRSARRASLRSALALRVREGALVVLEQFEMDAPKTRTVAEYTARVGSTVLVVDGDNGNLNLSSRNLPKSKYLEAEALNVFDVLKYEKLVLTKAAVEVIIAKATAAGKRITRDSADAVA